MTEKSSWRNPYFSIAMALLSSELNNDKKDEKWPRIMEITGLLKNIEDNGINIGYIELSYISEGVYYSSEVEQFFIGLSLTGSFIRKEKPFGLEKIAFRNLKDIIKQEITRNSQKLEEIIKMAEVLNLNLQILSDNFKPVLIAKNNIETLGVITYLREMMIDFQVILLDDPNVTREDDKISNYLSKSHAPFVIFDLDILGGKLKLPCLITSIGVIDNELGIKI